MPTLDANYGAVLVSGILAMAVGAFWYSPAGFGKQWMRLSGITPEQMNAGKGKMGTLYALGLLGAIVMATVLAFFVGFARAATASAGAQVGFWAWLGFIVPLLLGGVLWERKPWALFVLNAGYHLVVMVAMGVLLALWK
jgi:hypothetical protein